jgi:hypothetical protein
MQDYTQLPKRDQTPKAEAKVLVPLHTFPGGTAGSAGMFIAARVLESEDQYGVTPHTETILVFHEQTWNL